MQFTHSSARYSKPSGNCHEGAGGCRHFMEHRPTGSGCRQNNPASCLAGAGTRPNMVGNCLERSGGVRAVAEKWPSVRENRPDRSGEGKNHDFRPKNQFFYLFYWLYQAGWLMPANRGLTKIPKNRKNPWKETGKTPEEKQEKPLGKNRKNP